MKLDVLLLELAGHILSFIGLVSRFRSPDHRPVEECPEQEGIARRANTMLDAEACLQVGTIIIDFSPEPRAGDEVWAPSGRRLRGAARIVASVG